VTSPLLPTYARVNLAFERGDGAWLTSTAGERFLDFGGGIAVASLGYGHPHLVAALNRQGSKIWHTSNLFEIPQAERLAQRLVEVSFADYVFFTNSGAEAVEGAIKTARKYQSAGGHPERFRIVTFAGAFHGRTLATIAAAGNPKYLDGFGPRVEGFDTVPFGDIEAAKAAIGPQTGAILIEPIQGEGGIRTVPPSFLRGLRELCDKHGLLLMFDEVQTGMGRTGELFAYQRTGVSPDIMALGKALGGWIVPVSAMVSSRSVLGVLKPGQHWSTFGGNPLACAVGREVIAMLRTGEYQERSASLGAALHAGLGALPSSVVSGVSGRGLWAGVTFASLDGRAVCERLATLGVLAKETHGSTIRLAPPLVITPDELSWGLERFSAAVAGA